MRAGLFFNSIEEMQDLLRAAGEVPPAEPSGPAGQTPQVALPESATGDAAPLTVGEVRAAMARHLAAHSPQETADLIMSFGGVTGEGDSKKPSAGAIPEDKWADFIGACDA